MLTEKQKQIAWDAYWVPWNSGKLSVLECVCAAVEAVLAEQARAAEQKICRHGKREDEPCEEGYCFRAEQPTQPAAQSLWRAAKWNRITWECRRSNFLAWRPTEDGNGIEVLSYNYATLQIPSGSGLFSIVVASSLEAIGGNSAQQPAGDVVYVPKAQYDAKVREMTAALAVAREGYVSLEDALDSLSKGEVSEIEHIFGDCSKQQIDYLVGSRRARLAKPAEQQPEHVLEIESRHSDYGQDAGGYAVLRFDGEWIGRCDDREAAAKLIAYVAALKAGKQ
jgi:hypothetical protein